MLVVKTKLKESPINGIGLFADQDIKKGELVWREHPVFHRIISYTEYDELPPMNKEFVKKHATEYQNEGMFYLDLDDTRFINHSENPNTEWSEKWTDKAYALRDITTGEEITVDYLKLNPFSKSEVQFFSNQILDQKIEQLKRNVEYAYFIDVAKLAEKLFIELYGLQATEDGVNDPHMLTRMAFSDAESFYEVIEEKKIEMYKKLDGKKNEQ